MRTFLPPSPADLLMRDLERRTGHPDANSRVGVLLHLTGTVPELADLRAHVAARIPALPCLAHVLSGDGPKAQWLPAVPDPAHHISAQRMDAGPQALDTAVQDLLRQPWPEEVPAWRLVLLHGQAPDAFALLYLVHHTIQDGGNMIAVLNALFAPPLAPEKSAAVARDVPHVPRPRPHHVLRSLATLLRHFRKHHLWTWPLQPLSSRRHLLWTQAPAQWLHDAARAAGASTNDVCLTALTHAIAGWAGTAWPRAATAPIPVMVPVNLRTPGEIAAPGNRLFLTRVDLPGGTIPLGRRLAQTRTVTAALKSAEHKAVLRTVLTRLPHGPFQRLVALSTAPGRLTAGASYFVVRHRLRYRDAVVDRMDPIICCPPGTPLAVAVLVYGDQASACFRIDEALPGAESLPGRWRQALQELATAP